MTLSATFGVLSDLLERWEARSFEVREVRFRERDVVSAGEAAVDVTLSITSLADCADGDVRVADASIDGAGSLGVDLRAGVDLLPPWFADSEADLRSSEVAVEDGSLVASLTLGIPVSQGAPAEGHPEPTEDVADAGGIETVRDPELPPYEDTPYLEAVYESYDTFAEMADHLELDVAAETVRRYMIDAGIHEPSSYKTGAGTEEADVPPDQSVGVLVADGIGLPDELTIEHLIGTIKEATTLYEVQQGMRVERREALDILEELNLLDLVMGRLATEAERTVTREEIVERLRESAAA